ncbi:MAG: lysophospholipid acyltransferase family protein [Rhizobiaceae bacterium]|nr:lysophospholipid acyltransferase family protein [Rhizobiaceae bacterium]
MAEQVQQPKRPPNGGVGKRVWRKLRQPLVQSGFVKHAIAWTLARVLRFTYMTNRIVPGSVDAKDAHAALTPTIIALWHGQHILAPAIYPRRSALVAMVSRSADAELNALAVEKLGFEAVRGSGGRDNARHLDKGGARALIALKKALDGGSNVAMIADIPHGTPREAGLGVVTLAKLSGRPVVGLAVATSRRKVLEKTWDKTTINLPFGRMAVMLSEPIHVPVDADEATMEAKRRELTEALNAATAKAYAMVDQPQ